MLRQMEDSGIPAGTAVLEMNLLSADDLANAIRERILTVVTPLLQSKEGEFNFILSETMSAADLEYDPDLVFKEGGFPPNRLLGTADGEKIKPLKGLEESLKAGKALLRGSASAETTPASLNLGLGQPLSDPPRAAANAARHLRRPADGQRRAVSGQCHRRARRVHAHRRRSVPSRTVRGAFTRPCRRMSLRGRPGRSDVRRASAAHRGLRRCVRSVQSRRRLVRSRVARSAVPQRRPLRAQSARARGRAARVHESRA